MRMKRIGSRRSLQHQLPQSLPDERPGRSGHRRIRKALHEIRRVGRYLLSQGHETETPLNESIEVGLFTALPGLDTFDSSNVILMERRPIRSGRQVLKFVTDRKPLFAGVDPYNFYIDRDAADNVVEVR